MKKILVILTLFVSFFAHAQFDVEGKLSKTYKKNFSLAIGDWYDQDYAGALLQFKALSAEYPENYYLKFLIGDCLLELDEVTKAISLFTLASDSLVTEMTFFDYQNPRNTRVPYTNIKRLGIAYRINYEFDKALEQLNRYKKIYGKELNKEEKLEEKTDLEKEISNCNIAVNLVNDPVDINGGLLNETVNSKYADYAPVISADEQTLIFTSRRGEVGDLRDPFDFKYYEDIYISQKNKEDEWEPAKKISSNINSPGHEASIALSVDGQQLLIYSSQEDPDGDIYLSRLYGDVWSKPIPFTPVNSRFSETHACFNVDGSEVYFTSDREEGSYGGFDIYKIVLLPDGTWSLPINMGPRINSKYDETAPFMHPDGVTIYFSNNGPGTMGGFDVFKSFVDPETYTWGAPENIGYPCNTTGDDLFYVTSVDGNRAYYASEKAEGYGGKDLYILSLDGSGKDSKALTVMTGIFSMGENKDIPDDALITVKDSESGEVLGIYKPNIKTGKYLFILPPGKTYDVNYEVEGYLFKSENLIVPTSSSFDEISKEINLAPVQANESIVLNNVFFKFDSDGKGELEPIARNTNPDGSDNPEGRQLNRRIELKVLTKRGPKATVK